MDVPVLRGKYTVLHHSLTTNEVNSWVVCVGLPKENKLPCCQKKKKRICWSKISDPFPFSLNW